MSKSVRDHIDDLLIRFSEKHKIDPHHLHLGRRTAEELARELSAEMRTPVKVINDDIYGVTRIKIRPDKPHYIALTALLRETAP